jgi:hypothetical protein
MKLSFGKRKPVFEADALHWQVDMVSLDMLACLSERLHCEPEVGDGVEDGEGDVGGFTDPKRHCVCPIRITAHTLNPNFAAAPSSHPFATLETWRTCAAANSAQFPAPGEYVAFLRCWSRGFAI